MTLPDDFSQFVESFLAREVRFLVVGGHAVSVHARPRFTDDFDLWVGTDPDNAARVAAAIADFGFGSLGLSAADFSAPDVIVQLGRPPHRIDILTTLAGVEFEACWERRASATFGRLTTPLIGLDCLRANKRAVGRNKDLADLDLLDGLGD